MLCPVIGCYSSNFSIPIALDNQDIFLVHFVDDRLQLRVELFNLVIVIVRCGSINLDDCDVEWFRSQADVEDPARNRLTPQHNVLDVLVDKETYTICMASVVERVALVCLHLSAVHPSRFAEDQDVPVVVSHFIS